MSILNVAKYTLIGSAFCYTVSEAKTLVSYNKSVNDNQTDVFVKNSISPKGTDDKQILLNAPSSEVIVQGKKKHAKFVVNLTNNVLYKYNELGEPQAAYLVASGKKSTPTSPGVRVVSHVETYPYRYAPRRAKRRRNPRAYGPKIICLDKLNIKTGEKSSTGEFIHGNGNASSIGKYISHGCIRMDNEVIVELSSMVKRGDIVLILPNEN